MGVAIWYSILHQKRGLLDHGRCQLKGIKISRFLSLRLDMLLKDLRSSWFSALRDQWPLMSALFCKTTFTAVCSERFQPMSQCTETLLLQTRRIGWKSWIQGRKLQWVWNAYSILVVKHLFTKPRLIGPGASFVNNDLFKIGLGTNAKCRLVLGGRKLEYSVCHLLS